MSRACPCNAAASLPDLFVLQTNLIVVWALLEGQGMVAGLFLLLAGAACLLVVSAQVFVVGFALTFPPAEWFKGCSGRRVYSPDGLRQVRVD